MAVLARLLLAALLTSGLLAIPLAPAHADSNGPRLLSAQRVSPEVVGGAGVINLAFTAEDDPEPGSGVSYARFAYESRDADGALVAWPEVDAHGYQPLADGRALATRVLTPWAAAGRYTLARVQIWDHAGNITTYERAAPGTSGIDFAGLDFTVDNPQSDITVPTIDELQVSSRRVRAGEPIVVTSAPVDDRAGMREFSVSYESPSGVTPLSARADPVLAAAGVGSVVVPRAAEGGLWRATTVFLADRAGNSVYYDRDGREPIFRPTGVRPHAAQPPVDWAALDVEVVAGVPDAEAPTISDLRREGPATLHREDDLSLAFTTHDASALSFIRFTYYDRNWHTFTVMNACLPERGIAVEQVPQFLDDGPVQLHSILVVDDLFNVRSYARDGTVRTQGRSGTDDVPGFDLSQFDFELVPGAPSFTGRPHTRFGCPSLPKLPVSVPDAAAPGTPVDIVGRVLNSSDVPLPDAAVAVFAEPAGQAPELVGLTRTDPNGGYAVTDVMAPADTVYRVRFLGRDGPAGAEAMTGQPLRVRASSGTASASPAPSSSPDPSPSPDPVAPSSPAPSASPTPAAAATASAAPAPEDPPRGSADEAPRLALSPATISAGQPTTVRWYGTPGTTIDVLSRTQPATVFSRITQVTLDRDGTATTTHRPQKNTRITARSAGGLMSPDAPLIAVRSVASLNAHRLRTRTFTFTGRVYPALNNRLVNVYRDGTLFAQARSDATGVYQVTRTSGAGTFTFQARTPNDGHNLGTVSPLRRVTVS